MKPIASLGARALAALAAVSCTTLTPDLGSTAHTVPGVPGGTYTETRKIDATVTGIDRANRKLTFVTPDSKAFSTRLQPEVTNFDQVRIGDQLHLSLTTTVEVRMAEPGETITETHSYSGDVNPDDQKPGMFLKDSGQIAATVTHIDKKRRKATLTFPDGERKTFDVRPDIDLSQHHPGETVVIRATESYAAHIEAP